MLTGPGWGSFPSLHPERLWGTPPSGLFGQELLW